MAFTHLQPAEPTTVGYRLAQYGQDFLVDVEELRRVRDDIRGKGLKGAVGTSASYRELLGPGNDLEDQVLGDLGLEAWAVTTQTYPRKQDWLVLNALAGLAGSLHKFALDLRVLQSPPIGEWAEPFGRQQVGSSAMPFKRNPINAEKIGSLARVLAQLPRVAWDNAASSMLERTLDDSANRRLILPEAFLCADELLATAFRIVEGLQVGESAVQRNLAAYGVFAATERLLMAAVAAGANRQEMHEVIRVHSLVAWMELATGRANPLAERLAADERIGRYLTAEAIRGLLDAADYVGDAPERARRMAAAKRDAVA
jgi:adenylosuccinate lyase